MKTNIPGGLAVLLLAATLSGADENAKPLSQIESSDRQLIATFAPNGQIRITACDGTLIQRLVQCDPAAGAFSKDGELFCAAGRCLRGSGSIKVWHVSDGTLLCKLDNDMSEVPHLSFSDDATLLACTAGKSRVILWDISQNKARWTNSVGRGITSVRFDKQDATIIAECADKTTRRLSVENGNPLPTTESKGALGH